VLDAADVERFGDDLVISLTLVGRLIGGRQLANCVSPLLAAGREGEPSQVVGGGLVEL
jgi:hypothetical protein